MAAEQEAIVEGQNENKLSDTNETPGATKPSEAQGDANTSSSTPTPASTVSAPATEEIIPKHPLHNQWQLWYFRPDKARDWKDNLLDVTHFNTVEDFWALYNHIELASNLSVGSDYNVFKYGIQPMWEDERNKRGGRWLFTFHKNKITSRQLDEMWLEVLLCLIGEAFGEESDQVCGAVINIRAKMDKISVWTADAKNSQAILKIGRTVKQRTGFVGPVSFEAHEATQAKTGSSALRLYTI